MAQLDALQMTNCFSDGGEVRLRPGCEVWTTGMTGTPNSLWSYGDPFGVNKLFCATSFGIYNVTNSGAAGLEDVAWGLASTQWNALNFVNSAGNSFLWGVDGINLGVMYNGTIWANIVTTGLTSNLMKNPWQHARRIWAIERNSMAAWYLNIDSIQGPATKFPLGPLFKRGGHLVAGGSWSVDGGEGSDDYWAVITSEGECAIYKGDNPSSASSWGLVGVFYVGRPLHQRCFQNFGGDLLLLTESGLYPISKALPTAQVNASQALTDKIRPTFQEAARRSYENLTNIGWQCLVVPNKNAIMVSFPTGTDNQALYQIFVFNTVTRAWHLFRGWNARCMTVHNADVFFGYGTGTVARAWIPEVTSDFGQDIQGTVQTAPSYFRASGKLKQIATFRPLLFWDDQVQLEWGLVPDYAVAKVTSLIPRDTFTYQRPVWDVALWDVTPWETELFRIKNWLTASNNPGFGVSLLLQFTTKAATVTWVGTDFVVDDGGVG
jgi:hypothetical protein